MCFNLGLRLSGIVIGKAELPVMGYVKMGGDRSAYFILTVNIREDRHQLDLSSQPPDGDFTPSHVGRGVN